MHQILIVEDEAHMRMGLRDNLEFEGYTVTVAEDGAKGWEILQKEAFDLILLDVMMPNMSGFEVCKAARKAGIATPVIFLTAKGEEIDKVLGLEIGADDYMTKPFSMEELLHRIKAILRRSTRKEDALELQTEFKMGRFVFKSDVQKLLRDDGEEQRLTSKESALLRELCIYKNQIMDRSQALKKIWLDDNYFNSRSMDVYITKLRKFLKADENLQIINVHGQGFKLIELKS